MNGIIGTRERRSSLPFGNMQIMKFRKSNPSKRVFVIAAIVAHL